MPPSTSEFTRRTGSLAEYGRRFTAPHEYARQLRRAHELVLGGASRPEFPSRLLDSWQRSMALGISPDQNSPRHLHEPSDVISLRQAHPLHAALPALTELLVDEDSMDRHLLILTDAHGEVLWRFGGHSMLRKADSLEFIEGADWSEAGIGTNAISEVLTTGQPVQLFSAEHLVRTHHDWACTAAPIRDPATNEILGVLDVSGPLETLSADTLRMIRCGVRVAEGQISVNPSGSSTPAASPDGAAAVGPTQEGPAPHEPAPYGPAPAPASVTSNSRTRSAVASLDLLGEKPAAILENGSRIPLTLRRAEILTLLSSRNQGWSADELAYDLYGDSGTPATVRIEMHRIRSVLGDAIASNPYSLAASMTGASNVHTIFEYLRNGQVQQALDTYRAPLLTRSTALTVELLREELNIAVGTSVRTSENASMLIQWLESDMGSADAEAVTSLGRCIGTADPRYLSFRARTDLLERDIGIR